MKAGQLPHLRSLKSYNNARNVICAVPLNSLLGQVLCCRSSILNVPDSIDSFLVRHYLGHLKEQTIQSWVQCAISTKAKCIKRRVIYIVIGLWHIQRGTTFHKPSLANIINSVSSSIISTITSGSELRCSFKLLSPNALATANCPLTRGTSPEMTTGLAVLQIRMKERITLSRMTKRKVH